MEKVNKEQKEKIIVLIIILILAVISCGIFLKFHMITDTYWNIGEGYKDYKMYPLKDGRLVNYISLTIAEIINIPFEFYQLIMMIFSILLYSLSVFTIYNYLLEKLKNKSNIIKAIMFLGSYLIIFNPTTIESFAYTEFVIPLTIFLCTKSAILLDKNKTLKSILLVVLASVTYQGAINFFIALSLFLFIIKEKQDKKTWIKYIAKIIGISIISLGTMLITLKLVNLMTNTQQSRLHNANNLIETILNCIAMIARSITTMSFNLYPKNLIITYVIATILILLVFSEKNYTRLMFKYLFFILVVSLSCIMPIYMQEKATISARMSFSIGAIIGFSIIYIIFQKEKDTKAINLILSAISIIAICINTYNYVSIGMENIETQKQEKIYCEKVNKCIIEYEEKTGINVEKVAFLADKEYKSTYNNVANNTFTSKGVSTSYSNIHCLNYYTNRKLEKADIDFNIYYQYFKGKDWSEFNEEQIKFKEDTVYICIY